jgi:glycosyltransferase involved in cell wall biosynthesis
MRIAQIAPLHESVPPQLYGGTERVVSYLTDELVREGHDVTLFASGDSRTSARLVPICPGALRMQKTPRPRPEAWHLLQGEIVARYADSFDVLHNHTDLLLFSYIRQKDLPAVTTLHGRLDSPDLFPLFREYSEMCLISISDSQRAPMPWAGWMATVHHGLPAQLYTPCSSPRGDYLAFLGRASPEKGLDRAIEIARRAGVPIRVACKVDCVDQEYFDQTIRPLLDDPLVEYLGEIGESGKRDFLANAGAVLFPISWPEPFGLVMIESLACGTPVIAFPGGAVTEILEHGETGFIVSDVEAAAEAVSRIPTISRIRCRQAFETRFSARRMCHDYLRVYERLVDARQAAA